MMLQDSNKKTLNSAAEWLKKSDGLASFARRQQQDQALKTFLTKHIEDLQQFQDDFYIASTEEKKLCLHTSSALVASQLRLHQNLILQELQSEAAWKGSFTKLKVMVRPNFKKELSVQKKLPQISAETSSMLEQNAENIDHPELKRALQKLARQGRPNAK